MKLKVILVLCLVSNFVTAQDTSLLKQQVIKLNEALVAKDSIVLKQLLHPKLSFGHSNGWVQNFSDVFADMNSGKLQYKKTEASVTNINFTKKWAVVISNGLFEGNVSGTNFSLKLHVMQTWIWVKNKWVMVSRQSTKL